MHITTSHTVVDVVRVMRNRHLAETRPLTRKFILYAPFVLNSDHNETFGPCFAACNSWKGESTRALQARRLP